MMTQIITKPIVFLAAFLSAGGTLQYASAEEPKKDDKEMDKSDWQFTVGGGAMYAPDYEGSDDYETGAFPFFEVEWKERARLSMRGLEVDALKTQNLTIGLGVGMTESRDQSDNVALNGLGDIDTSVSGRVYGSYEWKAFEFGAELEQDLGDGHEGFVANFDANMRIPVIENKLMFMAGPSVTWASDDYMQSFFGVSSTQAANSIYSKYDASSGFKNAGFGIGARYMFNENVSLNLRAEYSKLLGDAADSPIVKDQGDENQFSTGLFLTYSF